MLLYTLWIYVFITTMDIPPLEYTTNKTYTKEDCEKEAIAWKNKGYRLALKYKVPVKVEAGCALADQRLAKRIA